MAGKPPAISVGVSKCLRSSDDAFAALPDVMGQTIGEAIATRLSHDTLKDSKLEGKTGEGETSALTSTRPVEGATVGKSSISEPLLHVPDDILSRVFEEDDGLPLELVASESNLLFTDGGDLWSDIDVRLFDFWSPYARRSDRYDAIQQTLSRDTLADRRLQLRRQHAGGIT
jgi:hypothetical protein